MEKGTLSGLRYSSDDASRPFPGLPRVIVSRLRATETGPATDASQPPRGPKASGPPPIDASPGRAACELVPAATPGAASRADHRQSSYDYKK